jgi:gamma-glutamylcyclotransferase (GGCT)/AIG2-like uncharacterized protein YtfP
MTKVNTPILVAAMGTLKEGQGNNRLLKHSIYIGPGYTSPDYGMKSLGGFPSLVSGKEEISIDIYEIDPWTLDRLDALEGYNRHETSRSFFNRELVEVYLLDGTPIPQVWIYLVQNQESIENNPDVKTRDAYGRLSW